MAGKKPRVERGVLEGEFVQSLEESQVEIAQKESELAELSEIEEEVLEGQGEDAPEGSSVVTKNGSYYKPRKGL